MTGFHERIIDGRPHTCVDMDAEEADRIARIHRAPERRIYGQAFVFVDMDQNEAQRYAREERNFVRDSCYSRIDDFAERIALEVQTKVAEKRAEHHARVLEIENSSLDATEKASAIDDSKRQVARAIFELQKGGQNKCDDETSFVWEVVDWLDWEQEQDDIGEDWPLYD